MFFLRTFKNFVEAELSFDEPVTLLVGPNGAGKSNLIEAVELLCFLASGRPLYEVTDLGREGGLEVRGGLDACPTWGHKEFTLGYHGEIKTSEGRKQIQYELTIRVGKEARITHESLVTQGRLTPLFQVLPSDPDSPSADNAVQYDNFAKGGNKPVTSAAADRTALSQYPRFARNNQRLAESLGLIDAVAQALNPAAVFDPLPRLMRGYERESETRLARNGFNISPVLADINSTRVIRIRAKDGTVKSIAVNKKEISEKILKRIAQLPDEPFTRFDFIRTKARDVMFAFHSAAIDQPIPARILSDGTLRALAVLVALETNPKNRRIIVEEFDNGVHPSRVQILTEALFETTARLGSRSLVTTHNPATLNALTPEQINSVLLVAQLHGQSQAQLIPLPELPGYIEFVEKGRLGDLITRRSYEHHLNDNYEQDRQARLLSWLENLP